jgi:hypothetical protein
VAGLSRRPGGPRVSKDTPGRETQREGREEADLAGVREEDRVGRASVPALD